MKKKFSGIIVTIVTIIFSFSAKAQIDNLSNLSPEQLRCGTRNAAIDDADVIAYNPGGASRIKPGFHLNIGNQSAFRHPKHEYILDLGAGPMNYSHKQDGNDLLTPNLYLCYNKDKWAGFGGLNVVAGGGEANFPHGSISTDLITLGTIGGANAQGGTYTNGKDAFLKASAYAISGFLGGSYLVSDKFSFGISARYVMGTNKSKAGVTIEDANGLSPDATFRFETKDKASGVGLVLGVDVMPTEKFNIALRYESKVKLEYVTDSIYDDFDLINDGEKKRRDLPATLALGLAYDVTDKVKLLFDFNYYFQKQADWDTTELSTGKVETSELAGDASTYALSAQYKFSDKFLWSLGGTYSLFSYKNKAGYFTNLGAYEIDPGNNLAISTGFAYNPTEKIRINVGFTESLYSKEDVKSLNYAASGLEVNVKTSNSISVVGIGLDFLF